MKKILLSLAALVCAATMFTSCEPDKNDDNTIKSPVVGTWNVPAVETDENESIVSTPFNLTWEAGDATLSFLPVSALPGLANQLGGVMITQMLKDITFSDKGEITATINDNDINIDLGGTTEPAEPVWVATEPGYATYKLQGNKMLVFLNLDKLREEAGEDGEEIDETPFKDIIAFVEKGIEVNYSLSDNDKELKLYIDKEYMTEIAAFAPTFAAMIPDDPDALGTFGPMVKGILNDLPAAMEKTTEFELSLTLKK